VMMRVFVEEGYYHPFRAVMQTPRGPNTVSVRNMGSNASVPIAATVGPENVDRPSSECLSSFADIEGGALRTYHCEPAVDSVQVLIKSDGQPLNARVELLQGRERFIKQAIELYTEDGLDRPCFFVFETPGDDNVVRIVNTARPHDVPVSAAVVPNGFRMGYEFNRSTAGVATSPARALDGYEPRGGYESRRGYGLRGYDSRGGYDTRAPRGYGAPWDEASTWDRSYSGAERPFSGYRGGARGAYRGSRRRSYYDSNAYRGGTWGDDYRNAWGDSSYGPSASAGDSWGGYFEPSTSYGGGSWGEDSSGPYGSYGSDGAYPRGRRPRGNYNSYPNGRSRRGGARGNSFDGFERQGAGMPGVATADAVSQWPRMSQGEYYDSSSGGGVFLDYYDPYSESNKYYTSAYRGRRLGNNFEAYSGRGDDYAAYLGRDW